MNFRIFQRFALGLGLAVCAGTQLSTVSAQAPSPPTGLRRLVPGTEITITPDRQKNETFSHQDLVELKIGHPELMNWPIKSSDLAETQTLRFAATQTPFRRSVWSLEFSFKPPRMIMVDFPTESGKMQQKVVWYIVYRVRNVGKHLQPFQTNEGTWDVKEVDQLTSKVAGQEQAIPINFVPTFSLETVDKKKAYLDRLIPVALKPIQDREDPNRRLNSTIDMLNIPIPLSTPQKDNSVWGVATWEDVDPRIDQFQVYVGGLTNVYRFTDPPGTYKPGDPPGTGRIFETKFLQLNFWRPSDAFTKTETEIYFGLPMRDPASGEEAVIDHQWVFR
ncbi:MAG: hypothetical protein SFX18_06465 [Pirellulales bacterium]|nr:hypothetical protein [Pirellulales bacterium]